MYNIPPSTSDWVKIYANVKRAVSPSTIVPLGDPRLLSDHTTDGVDGIGVLDSSDRVSMISPSVHVKVIFPVFSIVMV